MSMLIILVLGLLQCGGGSVGAILHGIRVRSGQFPWLVQFQTIVPCGGILVAPDWVLTAAQCVQYKRNSITLYAAGLNGTGSGQTVSIKATYIFPQYKAYSKINDREHNIALLKLSQSFDICDDTVQLVDVPVAPNNDYKSCLIFGWQSYVAPSAKVLAKPIQYSHVIPNTWKICMHIFNGNTSYTNVFCVMMESENGIKACAGNPGSPVVCEDRYHRMILLGIASWSNFSLECEGLPTYLRVSDFRSWMYDLILNDKKLEEWDKGSKYNKGPCGYRGYFRGMLSGTDTSNYSHLSASEYQRQTNKKTTVDKGRVNRIWQPLQLGQEDKQFQASAFSVSKSSDSPSKVDNFLPQTNGSSRISLGYEIPSGILKKQDDTLKQYQEVGQSQRSYSRIEDIISAFSMGEGKSSYLDWQSTEESTMEDLNAETKVQVDDDMSDTDFTIPLDDEYFMGRAESLHMNSREKSLFMNLIITFFVSCIVIF